MANASRSTISLPAAQEELMSALYKEDKSIVLILSSGRTIEPSRLEPMTNSIIISGKETVLWFISDPACTISSPIKELKFFEKKEIQPGESKVYTFIINLERDLSYVDSDGNPLLEKDLYYLRVKDKCIKIEVID